MQRIDTLVRAGTLNSAVLQDLFGDEVTKPRSMAPKHILNAAHGFVEFWTAWPPGIRKVAKQQTLDKWAKLGCADNASHILAHVEFMKKTKDWQKDEGSFVPMPATYLNQQRWSEWERPAERPAGPTALEKIKADDAICKPPPAEIRAKLNAFLEAAKRGRA